MKNILKFLLILSWPVVVVSRGYSVAAVSRGYSPAAVSRGYSLAVVHGLLTVVASLVAKHGL